ncbi:hypothetical protein CIPAW_13G178700 [Carya illinoinensis]|uniref:Uncharacterized protein n=1 Tax=Carya illinoinensis TaxID=32201 RepID=A0A8T1NVH1_CARIL|nr:hypothetical protein CIPAW_13G178700 [Carya illinoinensis]
MLFRKTSFPRKSPFPKHNISKSPFPRSSFVFPRSPLFPISFDYAIFSFFTFETKCSPLKFVFEAEEDLCLPLKPFSSTVFLLLEKWIVAIIDPQSYARAHKIMRLLIVTKNRGRGHSEWKRNKMHQIPKFIASLSHTQSLSFNAGISRLHGG